MPITAHPRRLVTGPRARRRGALSVEVPDLGDARRNRGWTTLMEDFGAASRQDSELRTRGGGA